MKHLFIVGAQRSGSTYLHSVLADHPQIRMNEPVKPEPKFFLNKQSVANGKEYFENTYFPGDNQGIMYFGEKSASYLESPEAAKNIISLYPEARILLILRDPVQRAYSNYRYSVSNNLEKLTFDEALAAEPIRRNNEFFTTSVSPFAYFQRGHYINYIKSYLKVFDSKQIRVLIFEEFICNLQSVQKLYHWLGIKQNFEPPSLHKTINPNSMDKSSHHSAFRNLVRDYQGSITELESLLGRKIVSWRNQHHKIMKQKII